MVELQVKNSETNSKIEEQSILKKIARGRDRIPSDSKDYHTFKEFGIDFMNSGIKAFAAGLTLSGSVLYKVGKWKYLLEKKWGERDSEMDEKDQKYRLSVRQHYSEKYQTRRENWTLKYTENK